MAMHKLLIDEFYDTSFSLIAIHCRLEDYRMSYLINKHLNLYLKRLDEDLDFKRLEVSYSLYEWIDQQNGVRWNLISNRCHKEEESFENIAHLFESDEKIVKIYHLMPDLKEVDYLIKINHDQEHFDCKSILTQIQNIPQVITSYEVNANQLKFKDHLIF